MKKPLLLLTVFLFFAFLSAEEVQVGEYTIEDVTITLFEERKAEPEKEPEVQPEPELNTEGMVCCCDVFNYGNIDPKKFYIQPALGVGTGFSLYRFNLSLDAGFLVARTKKINYYIGLDIDTRISGLFLLDPRELALQVSGVFDFIQEGVPELMSASLWISAGIDLFLIRDTMEGGDVTEEHHFEYSQAWGFGVDLVFKNYVILKFGLEGIIGIWPDLTIAVGYRF